MPDMHGLALFGAPAPARGALTGAPTGDDQPITTNNPSHVNKLFVFVFGYGTTYVRQA